MRIAIYSDNFYPEISGISDSIITLGRSLSGRGHKVDFYAPFYTKKNFAIGGLPFQELDLGPNVTISRFWSSNFPAPTQQGRLVVPTGLRWIGKNKIKPDVIHTQDFFGVGLEALAAAKHLKVPMVGTSHTPMIEFTRYSPVRNEQIDNWMLKYVAWYYNHCAFVTAPSQGILDEMKNYGFTVNCRPISNPLDNTNFFPVPAAEKSRLKKDFGLSSFTILYTGRIATEKHIDVIIRALKLAQAKIPEINFALTGHGSATEELKKLAQELEVDGRIKFIGLVDLAKLTQLYQASDLFVITSTAETQSLSMMKGMATALPVIGAKARGLAEYIKDGYNGLHIEPGDHKSLAEKIIYLYEHPEVGAKLGQGGREFVQQFSVEKITDGWIDIYETAIANYRLEGYNKKQQPK